MLFLLSPEAPDFLPDHDLAEIRSEHDLDGGRVQVPPCDTGSVRRLASWKKNRGRLDSSHDVDRP